MDGDPSSLGEVVELAFTVCFIRSKEAGMQLLALSESDFTELVRFPDDYFPFAFISLFYPYIPLLPAIYF